MWWQEERSTRSFSPRPGWECNGMPSAAAGGCHGDVSWGCNSGMCPGALPRGCAPEICPQRGPGRSRGVTAPPCGSDGPGGLGERRLRPGPVPPDWDALRSPVPPGWDALRGPATAGMCRLPLPATGAQLPLRYFPLPPHEAGCGFGSGAEGQAASPACEAVSGVHCPGRSGGARGSASQLFVVTGLLYRPLVPVFSQTSWNWEYDSHYLRLLSDCQASTSHLLLQTSEYSSCKPKKFETTELQKLD